MTAVVPTNAEFTALVQRVSDLTGLANNLAESRIALNIRLNVMAVALSAAENQLDTLAEQVDAYEFRLLALEAPEPTPAPEPDLVVVDDLPSFFFGTPITPDEPAPEPTPEPTPEPDPTADDGPSFFFGTPITPEPEPEPIPEPTPAPPVTVNSVAIVDPWNWGGVLHDRAWSDTQTGIHTYVKPQNDGVAGSVDSHLTLEVGAGPGGGDCIAINTAGTGVERLPAMWVIPSLPNGQRPRLWDDAHLVRPYSDTYDQLRVRIKLPVGYRVNESHLPVNYPDNIYSWVAGTYIVTPEDVANGAVESQNWHFYHRPRVNQAAVDGQWHDIVINSRPTHQRTGSGAQGGLGSYNPVEFDRDGTFMGENYWSLVTRMYFTGHPYTGPSGLTGPFKMLIAGMWLEKSTDAPLPFVIEELDYERGIPYAVASEEPSRNFTFRVKNTDTITRSFFAGVTGFWRNRTKLFLNDGSEVLDTDVVAVAPLDSIDLSFRSTTGPGIEGFSYRPAGVTIVDADDITYSDAGARHPSDDSYVEHRWPQTPALGAIDSHRMLSTWVQFVHGPVVIPEPIPEPTPEPTPVIPVDVTPGTELISRDFTTVEEIDAFHYTTSMRFSETDPRACQYDATLGGAVCPIIPGEQFAMLRNDNANVPAPATGRVYVEYEFYVPQSLYDLPFAEMNWDTMKTFRMFNNTNRQTTNETAGTVNMLPGRTVPTLWLREVGTMTHPDAIDSGNSIDLKYIPPANTWVKLRFIWDYDANHVEAYMPGKPVMVIPATGLRPIDNVAPLLHSTSRGHGGNDLGFDIPETFLGYRNVRMGYLG